jgi:hypothetical protein
MKNKKSAKSAFNKGKTFDVSSMDFWRGVTQSILPKEKDKWRIGEIATQLRLLAGHIQEGWDAINRVAAETEGKMNLGIAFKTDRAATPPKVDVVLSFSEKHTLKAESDVPDLEQLSLPNEIGNENQEEDPDEPPRVRAGIANN